MVFPASNLFCLYPESSNVEGSKGEFKKNLDVIVWNYNEIQLIIAHLGKKVWRSFQSQR